MERIIKMIDYNLLFRIYEIIRDFMKNGHMDVAERCILSLGDYYGQIFNKFRNEPNAEKFFNEYTAVIGKLAERLIDDLTDSNMRKEPYKQ